MIEEKMPSWETKKEKFQAEFDRFLEDFECHYQHRYTKGIRMDVYKLVTRVRQFALNIEEEIEELLT